jgi:WD40 repeat protein
MKLWNLSNGRELVSFGVVKGPVLCGSFSPDNRFLATSGTDRLIRIWDCSTGKLVKSLTGHQGYVKGIAFSTHGDVLISGDGDDLILWEVIAGQPVAFRSDVDNDYRAIFSPDGKMVASARKNGSVILWRSDTQEMLHVLDGHTDQVRALAFSPNGRLLATGGKDNTVRLWDVETGTRLKEARCDFVQRVEFSPDGRRVVTGGIDGSVKLWDVTLWQELMTMEGYVGEVTTLKFSSDGTALVTCADDGSIRLWRAPRVNGR